MGIVEATTSAEAAKTQLMALPNVVGVGVGLKRRAGQVIGEESVVVFVRRKLPMAQLAKGEAVPERVGETPTDVVEVGDLKALATWPAPEPEAAVGPEHRARLRPARPGGSIGHFKITAGTFGAVVYDTKTNEPLILSNNHVLANSQPYRGRRAKAGDAIYQPGPYDGGTSTDTLAELVRYVPLRFPPRAAKATAQSSPVNLVDAAVARPLRTETVQAAILEVGEPLDPIDAQLEMPVQKSGRTTGLTEGRVTALHATLQVSYGNGQVATFAEQLVLGPMSQGGDSGSLIVDQQRRAVALLFAGSDQATIACPIRSVLMELGVKLRP